MVGQISKILKSYLNRSVFRVWLCLVFIWFRDQKSAIGPAEVLATPTLSRALRAASPLGLEESELDADFCHLGAVKVYLLRSFT